MKSQFTFLLCTQLTLILILLDFFDENSKIFTEPNINIFDYIEELRNAFSFNKEFYTASHYIERNKANYYALFFIGHHIYGLEKFIEAKWKNDSLGKGFNQSKNSNTLFGETLLEYDKNISISKLEKLFREIIEEKVSNIELYEFILKNQFQREQKKCDSWAREVSYFLQFD